MATTVVADTQLQTGQRLAIGFTEVAKPGQVNAEEAFKAGLIYVPTVLICYTSSTASISPYRINRESHDGNLKVGVRLRAALPMMVIFIGESASWKARRGSGQPGYQAVQPAPFVVRADGQIVSLADPFSFFAGAGWSAGGEGVTLQGLGRL